MYSGLVSQYVVVARRPEMYRNSGVHTWGSPKSRRPSMTALALEPRKSSWKPTEGRNQYTSRRYRLTASSRMLGWLWRKRPPMG